MLPTFLPKLSEAVGNLVGPEDLIPLPETDALMDKFRSGYQDAVKGASIGFRKFFPPPESGLVFRLAERFADQIRGEDVFFLTKLSEYCGAIKLNVSALLTHAESIIQLDGDSLSALSMDHAEGILIDYNADDPEQRFEFSVWGNRWPLVVLACSENLTQ